MPPHPLRFTGRTPLAAEDGKPEEPPFCLFHAQRHGSAIQTELVAAVEDTGGRRRGRWLLRGSSRASGKDLPAKPAGET